MRISSRNQGFTLLELMVALVVVSILLTVGLPSFSATVRQNCTITAANTMLTVLTAARSEALKRDRIIGVCKSIDGVSCATGPAIGWERGYIMYVDLDANDAKNASEPLLRAERPLATCATIVGTGTPGGISNRLAYDGLGKINVAGNFTIQSSDLENYRRRVVISPTGRPRVCDPDKVMPGSATPCGGSS